MRVLFDGNIPGTPRAHKEIRYMELIDIIPSESKLWEQTWRLYNESFPECERRRISSHHRAVDDPRFYTKVALENGNLLGLLFFWRIDDQRIYIEHIAVNPSMRGRNIGSTLLSTFLKQNSDAVVILEIDPPLDEISVRRLGFYQRLGFNNSGIIYKHPSYQKKGQEHDLLILSYPGTITESEFEEFRVFLRDEVLKYVD